MKPRYVILQQTKPAAIVFARKGDDWVSELLTEADAMLNLPEIGCSIPLRECYTDVELTSGEAPGSA